ncbi:hypothetical protein DY000_02017971 [Brassica cretica]|uniref:Transposase MuDR plant domain-containing protein n=1 Tax=Brassica cretica TaxID=69181 RepID=A0ABQ7CQC6_BRACR|nr:hypothetical protein DY000_02017971 [Brassica cretica]
MMLAPNTPPIHVTSDRQVQNLLEITKTHGVWLCVSSRSKEDDGEEDDREEDVDISIVAEADENGEDYSVHGKVEDADEEDDDMCFEDFKKIEGGRSNGNSIYVNQSFVSKDALLSELRLTALRFRFSFRIYKSTKTLLVTTCPVSGCQWKVRASVKHGTNTFWVTKYVEKHTCSAGDRLAQRRHCTPKYVGRLFIDRVGIIDGLNPQHITDAMKNMFGMTLDYTTSYRALLYAQTLVRGSAEDGSVRVEDLPVSSLAVEDLRMMRQLHEVYGEWLLKYCRWDFVVDNVKGVRIFIFGKAPDTPPIHVTSDRQVRNLLEITKTHGVWLCVSSRSKVETASEFREEDDEADECFEEDDDDLVEDENHDGEEDDGEEDVGISIVAKADENGEDYNVYGKVEDEDEEDDDMCFVDIKKIEGGRSNGNSIYVNQSFVSKDALLSELRLTAVRFRFSFRIYKSTKTLLVTTCPVSGCQWKVRASVKHGTNTFWVTKYVEKHTCSVGDRLAQRRHCTPKYVGRLFIDRVGIIDGLNPQHITDAMKNMFGMTLDYTTSYRALLYAQTLPFKHTILGGLLSFEVLGGWGRLCVLRKSSHKFKMMRQLHAVYGEWLLKDCRWDFVVDNVKGARIFFLSKGSTHAELLAMAQEDYNLDMSTKSVEITYSLPVEMMLAPDTPPIHVTNDDDDLVEDENHDGEESDGEEDDGEEDDGEEDDGEEDADISIVAEADENGEDYSVYGKVEDEDEEDDDIKDALLSELRLTAVRLRFSFRIYKSTKTLLVTTCPVSGCEWKIKASVKHGTNTFWVTKYVEKHRCSVEDQIAQRRHCTPKYVGRLFIDLV